MEASKNELNCVLPLIGKRSVKLTNCLWNSKKSHLDFCKLKFVL